MFVNPSSYSRGENQPRYRKAVGFREHKASKRISYISEEDKLTCVTYITQQKSSSIQTQALETSASTSSTQVSNADNRLMSDEQETNPKPPKILKMILEESFYI